jgi:NAD(P)-dependent dehydrogenase (short-subunit alcohol dehydrogenase family)
MTTILITGASRGIGRATALLCAAAGARIGLNYAGNLAAARATEADIIAAGGNAVLLPGDVAHEADVTAMFAALDSIDHVVINAGIAAPASQLADMSLERLKRVFDVNILGAYLCAREAARRLSTARGGRGGSIVFVSSIAARLGSPHQYVDYAGSKGAIDTLTLGLAKELAPEGVRVNAVRPGLIETDIHAAGGEPDRATRLGATTPMGRAGQPEEIAAAIIWLMSDAASYTTGALLDVGGGR